MEETVNQTEKWCKLAISSSERISFVWHTMTVGREGIKEREWNVINSEKNATAADLKWKIDSPLQICKTLSLSSAPAHLWSLSYSSSIFPNSYFLHPQLASPTNHKQHIFSVTLTPEGMKSSSHSMFIVLKLFIDSFFMISERKCDGKAVLWGEHERVEAWKFSL